MYRKITLLLVILLSGYCSALAFDQESNKDKEKMPVDHGHWFTGEVIKKLNYDSLWIDAASLKNSLKGQNVLKNCIEKYGGLEHLKTLENLEIEYISKSLLSESKPQKVQMFFNHELKHKKITNINDSTKFTTILNGNMAIKKIYDKKSSMEKNEFKSELFSYLVLSMPAKANLETFTEIKYGTRLDDSLDYVYLKKEDSLIMCLGIDPKNNLIKKIEGIVIDSEREIVYINYFSDFKEHQGFMLPFTKMNVSMGLKMSEYNIISVKINQDFDDNTFKVE